MRPVDVPALSSLLSLLLIEPLPLYAFQLAFIECLATLGADLELWWIDPSQFDHYVAQSKRNETVGDFQFCVRNDVWNAALSLNQQLKGECIDWSSGPSAGTQVYGLMNLGCFVLCVIVIAWETWTLFAGGSANVCSGAYLANKWKLQHSFFYKFMTGLLLGYVVLLVVATWWSIDNDVVLNRSTNLQSFALSFVFNNLASVAVLVGSAFALTRSTIIHLDYEREGFDHILFCRGWTNVLTMGCANFGQQLENAILKARMGQTSSLRSLLLNEKDIGLLVESYVFSDAEDLDNTDGSASE